jgi:RNA polymerase sigma factor (sigma-70 family)
MSVNAYTSDFELWRDFLDGSATALAQMYEQYAPVLYNYGFKIAQDRALTEDCIQDIFLTILERRERLSPTNSIKFYLFRALRREIVKRLRQRHHARTDWDERNLEFAVRFSASPSWLDERISEESSQQLLQMLNGLPTRQKEAIFLRFYDELSYEEIAGIMEIEQNSAYKIVYKALGTLQQKLPAWTLFALLFTGNNIFFKK